VGVASVVELAMEAWREMFGVGVVPSPNPGIVRAFQDVGIMPFNPDALPDVVFEPAEAAAKELAAAQARLGITPEERMDIVDHALPFVSAIPVDLDKAKQVARKQRGEVPQLLTSLAVRNAAAQKILEKQATEEEKVRRREARKLKQVAGALERQRKAEGVAERKAARAVKAATRAAAPRKRRRQEVPDPAPTIAPVADCGVPLAGQKRPATSAGIVGPTSGEHAPIMLRFPRKQPRVDGDA
jgi:hypothetical protein